jgi:hypothetical protein
MPQPPTAGPKYQLDIEGTLHPWDKDTITVPEIRTLGSLPTDQPVIEINLQDNTERQLAEGEVVTIKPGHGFAKKLKFKRA